MTEWKQCPVEGFEHYNISDDGQVFNTRQNQAIATGKRQIKVRLYNWATNQVRWFNISKLVALAFIPNPDDLKYVIHISSDLDDNRVSNLKWTNQRREGVNQRDREVADKEFLEMFEKYKTIRELMLNLDVSKSYVLNTLRRLGLQPVHERLQDINTRAAEAFAMEQAGATIDDIAAFYSVSRSNVYRWLRIARDNEKND